MFFLYSSYNSPELASPTGKIVVLSSYTVLCTFVARSNGVPVPVPVHFFLSLPLIFTLVAGSISQFLTIATKFSCFSSDKIGLSCFFISRSSSFSVIHVNVDMKI